jgi:hypothetical protein
MQVGQYRFTVVPPSTLRNVTVLGSPLTVTVKAGSADPTRSSAQVSAPVAWSELRVGSVVNAQITLQDAHGNKIVAPAVGQYNSSRLAIYGEHS